MSLSEYEDVGPFGFCSSHWDTGHIQTHSRHSRLARRTCIINIRRLQYLNPISSLNHLGRPHFNVNVVDSGWFVLHSQRNRTAFVGMNSLNLCMGFITHQRWR